MPSGSRPGERRAGGRKKGTPNKITDEVRKAAQKYTTKALKVFADVMNNPEASVSARVT